MQSFAVFLAICGAVLVSAKFSEIRKLRLRVHEGVALALVSAFCWGVSVFLFKPVSSIATGQAILFLELGTLASLVLAGFFLKKKFSAPPANVFPNIAAAQSLNSFGSIALIVGYSTSPASIVAPISALYPVVALGLAFVFLKERLDLSQKFGVAVSICALFLAAI